MARRPNSRAFAPRRSGIALLLAPVNSLREKVLGFFQLRSPARTQIASTAVDEIREHAHSGGRPFRRNSLRCQRLRDHCRTLRKQPLRWMSRVGRHARNPAAAFLWTIAALCCHTGFLPDYSAVKMHSAESSGNFLESLRKSDGLLQTFHQIEIGKRSNVPIEIRVRAGRDLHSANRIDSR